jgi:hypothetical protein
MSVQLTIDEMMSILVFDKSPRAGIIQAMVEELGETLAYEIDAGCSYLKRNGQGSTEFNRYMAPFAPTQKGPLPQSLLELDIETEEYRELQNDL